MPRSKAICRVAMDSTSSTTPPCSDIRKQPKPIGETDRSVVPNLMYSMDFSSLCWLWLDRITTNELTGWRDSLCGCWLGFHLSPSSLAPGYSLR